MYYTYVLYSEEYKRTYVGHTSELARRLKEHNLGKTKSTKPYVPWEIIYSEEFFTREEAIIREKYFKTSSGRRFMKNTIFNELKIIR